MPTKERVISPVYTLEAVQDFAALGLRWRALEARAEASFFQSWTWVGCRATTRFPDPVLLAVQINGQDAALGLFNRHPTPLAPRTLRLNETGQRQLDAIYVEHNGLLLARGQEALLASTLRWLLGTAGVERVILSGVDAPHLIAAQQSGAAWRRGLWEPAPCIDFTTLPGDYLASLSANTRAQIRRSDRHYAQDGALRVERAGSKAEARAMFEALGVLHQATWTARGKPGAFANPEFLHFHHELLGRGFSRGETDLLCVRAGERVIGYLYNFRYGNRVLTYQSGFAYPQESTPRKPGLTTHHIAIEMYCSEGAAVYDFLAGEDRYKSSLSNAQTDLYWVDLAPLWSPRGLVTWARHLIGR